MKLRNINMNKSRSYLASFKQIHCYIVVHYLHPETQEIRYKMNVFSLFADELHVHV